MLWLHFLFVLLTQEILLSVGLFLHTLIFISKICNMEITCIQNSGAYMSTSLLVFAAIPGGSRKPVLGEINLQVHLNFSTLPPCISQ